MTDTPGLDAVIQQPVNGTYTREIAARELERLRAERQQAIDERDAARSTAHAYMKSYERALHLLGEPDPEHFGGEPRNRLAEQAIDALREIEHLTWSVHDVAQTANHAVGIARAALLNLGEQP